MHSFLLKLIIQGFGHLTLEIQPAVYCIQKGLKIYDIMKDPSLPKMSSYHSGKQCYAVLKYAKD